MVCCVVVGVCRNPHVVGVQLHHSSSSTREGSGITEEWSAVTSGIVGALRVTSLSEVDDDDTICWTGAFPARRSSQLAVVFHVAAGGDWSCYVAVNPRAG